MKRLLICMLFCGTLLIAFVHSKPTVYKINENDKLEPVLVPVSSTVIPLPVYKVGFGVGVNGAGKKPVKPDEATKLLTAHKKKTANRDNDDDESINIKEISKDEYEKRT